MLQILMCKFLGAHRYEPYKEETRVDKKGNKVGLVIVSKCSICGKISNKIIYTEEA